MYPRRIVCLAAETPEILHDLGVLDRVVGVSAYTKVPNEALNLPRITGFKFGHVERILELKPDLAILTSYVQSELAAELIAHGVHVVHVSPHRLNDLFDVVTLLGNLVGRTERAQEICEAIRRKLEQVTELANCLSVHPKVFFEHTSDPISVPPAWVSDIIHAAGGIDVFRDVALRGRMAVDRVVQQEDVIQANPDLFFCHTVHSIERNRVRWNRLYPDVAAIRNGRIYRVQSSIFYFGPRTLIDALNEVHSVIRDYFR